MYQKRKAEFLPACLQTRSLASISAFFSSYLAQIHISAPPFLREHNSFCLLGSSLKTTATVITKMLPTSHSEDADSFGRLSDDFLAWLACQPGVRVSPKIQIADLRFQGAGRGVGKSIHAVVAPCFFSASLLRSEISEMCLLTS